MKEVVYSFEEFKAKVDTSKPVHHHGLIRAVDKQGIFYDIVFCCYGVSRNNHIILFEARKRKSITEREKDGEDYQKFVENFGKPLGSTEGKWIE